MSVKNYQELLVWQKAMDLVEAIYRTTTNFPNAELYGLTSQVRRAAVSIAANIAEGQGRTTTREFLNFLSIANGSLRELETHVLISSRLGYINGRGTTELIQRAAEVGRLLNGLVNSLRRKTEQP